VNIGTNLGGAFKLTEQLACLSSN